MRAPWNWPLIRAHLCTVAVSVSFNCTWRVPREGFRFGGLQYGLALTAASALMMPLALLQLAFGQLSQQDAVGLWRAVPFFKGIGYIRLLVSFLGCVYTVVYVALTATFFLYTLSHDIPFEDCTNLQWIEGGYVNMFNASDCLNSTFLAPISERPEYYISMSLIILFLWITLPFLLYSPVKLMKRVFYVLGPVVVVCGVVLVACLGSSARLAHFHHVEDWDNFLQPQVWFGAITQALISNQVAGGYLISAGDSVYSSTNVQWTAIAFVLCNILASWAGLLFWFAVGGSGDADTSSVAVLVQMYRLADEEGYAAVWPLLVFAVVFLSGVITMLIFLYPVMDRTRRCGGVRWRVAGACGAAVGAGASLAALVARAPALAALEDFAVPLLAATATVLETIAFVFVYGWKVLMEDIGFLTGRDLAKYWVFGWCAAPVVLAPLALWWAVTALMGGAWAAEPWSASVVVTALGLFVLVLLASAAVVVARQVQYDVFGKLKSSFKPSRHWGPRDPISHYYWVARREGSREGPSTRYQRPQPGQLSGAPSFLNISRSESPRDLTGNDPKRRSNSDDWIYTIYRRKCLEQAFAEYMVKSKRSMSLDWGRIPRVSLKKDPMELKMIRSSVDSTPVGSIASIVKDRQYVVHK